MASVYTVSLAITALVSIHFPVIFPIFQPVPFKTHALTQTPTECSDKGNGETCQTQIFALDTGSANDHTLGKHEQSSVYVYNLNTIGSVSMIDREGVSLASFADNVNGFPDTIAVFRTD